MILRDADPADAPAIAAIYAHEVLDGLATAEEVAPTPAEMAARIERTQAAALPWIVAEIDGAVAGYAYARPYHARAAYRFTVEDAVYIAPPARGRGVGSALLAELITRATSLGKAQMIASITVQDGRASLALHRRHGFHEVGRMGSIVRKFDRWVDVAYLQRALRPD